MKTPSAIVQSLLNNRRDALWFSLICLPVILFYGMVFNYSVDVPSLDDFLAILGFMNRFVGVDSFLEKLSLIFSQHNEHRIVFTRITALAIYYLGGSVNFKLLIVAGNLALLGLIFLIYHSANIKTAKLLYFAPAILLMFQPSYFESMLWAMASTSNFYILFFAFLSIYLLTHGSYNSFIFAVIFAISASYTQGNGILVFFPGLFLLFHQGRYKYGLAWSLIFVLCLFIYFYGYEKPPPFPGITAEPFSFVNAAKYFLLFIGSIGKYRGLANMLGAFVLVSFLYLTHAKYYKSNPIIYAFLIFMLLTSVSAAYSRANMGLGIGQALASRYTINSAIFLLLTYLALLELCAGRYKLWVGIGGASVALTIFISYWIIYTPYFKLQRDSLIQGINQAQMGNNSGLNYLDKNVAMHILTESRIKHIYVIPSFTQ